MTNVAEFNFRIKPKIHFADSDMEPSKTEATFATKLKSKPLWLAGAGVLAVIALLAWPKRKHNSMGDFDVNRQQIYFDRIMAGERIGDIARQYKITPSTVYAVAQAYAMRNKKRLKQWDNRIARMTAEHEKRSFWTVTP